VKAKDLATAQEYAEAMTAYARIAATFAGVEAGDSAVAALANST